VDSEELWRYDERSLSAQDQVKSKWKKSAVVGCYNQRGRRRPSDQVKPKWEEFCRSRML